MAEGGAEQDKSEAATPFKLDRARKRGMLPRGTDLGFVSALVAFAIISQVSGHAVVQAISDAMRRGLIGGIAMAREPIQVSANFSHGLRVVALSLLVPAFLLLAICVTMEVIQNRGLVFSAEPLKPDFSRINPAKGLKRLFSLRMLKELLKNIVKSVLYGGASYLFIRHAIDQYGIRATDGRQLPFILLDAGSHLLILFIVLAIAIALLDQILARGEFAKQMRMSRRDVTREVREREGEPRQKRKRKQILAEILKQAAAAANVKGADILIVNPTHYAVALRYRPEESDAPILQARGRNYWAQRMRKTAEREGITIVRNPTLARALYHDGKPGKPIGQRQYVAVADIYIALRRALQNREQA